MDLNRSAAGDSFCRGFKCVVARWYTCAMSASPASSKSHPKIGLFPGTFDPMTNGHLDVIRRGQSLFDRLIVAVGHNPAKREIFSTAERQEMIEEILRAECEDHVEVRCFSGLTVDFARESRATAILRGIRNVTDLNFEFQLALTNRAIADIETVFIMTGESTAFTSSTLINRSLRGAILIACTRCCRVSYSNA